MKKLILTLLLLNISMAFAFENVSIPAQNSGMRAEESSNSVISSEEFDALEKRIFKKTFGSDTSKNRLSRLEKEIFGMEQKGDEEERFENLITASDYYTSGYRQNQSVPKTKPETKINPQDYIVNYNFEDNMQEEEIPRYSVSQKPYYTTPSESEPVKKPSKIKQFFEGLADVITSGIITGYTLPIDSFGMDPFNTMNNFGGSNYIGLPQFPTYYPQSYVSPYRYNRARYPYVSRNNYYTPPPPRYNYNRTPYYKGRTNHKTGSGVKIIY